MAKRRFYGGGGGRKGFGAFPVSTFTGLSDTPGSFPTAYDILQVNSGKTALELIPGRGQVNGVASLDGTGKVPASELPAIAVTDFLGVVASQAAMLALSGQKGDWCIRSDLDTTWIITGDDPSQISDWTEIEYPGTPYYVMADSSDTAPGYLNAKIIGTSGIDVQIIGAGNRQVQISPQYGSTANKVCEGDDARLSDARTPLAHNLAGAEHNADTKANLDGKISDATLLSTQAGEIAAMTVKASPVGADILMIEDSAASNAKKKVTLSTIGVTFAEHLFYADQLMSPNNADWAVNALAPANPDNSNNALIIRAFDDTTEEGTGWLLELPSAATGMIFYFRSRAFTAPVGARQVVPALYTRQIPNNSAPTAWSSRYVLTPIDITTSSGVFFYDSQSIPFATLGLTAGNIVQFELTRYSAHASDTLVGDWFLLELKIVFY